MYIPLIFIGNVGIEESYIYILCGMLCIAMVYFSLKSVVLWMIKRKLHKLFNYLISSLPILIAAMFIASFMDNPNKIMWVTLQSLAIFGMLFSLFIWIERFLRKTN